MRITAAASRFIYVKLRQFIVLHCLCTYNILYIYIYITHFIVHRRRRRVRILYYMKNKYTLQLNGFFYFHFVIFHEETHCYSVN